MASTLGISSVKINGTIYFAGQELQGRRIAQIQPAIISNDREIMHEFVLMSEKHIVAILRDYANTDHHIEYKLGSSKVISFDFNGTPYHLENYINGMLITDIGHVIQKDVPDAKIYLLDAAMETIDSMANNDNIEVWYKPYSVF